MTHKQKKLFNATISIICILLTFIFNDQIFSFIALGFWLGYYKLDIAESVVDLVNEKKKGPTTKR